MRICIEVATGKLIEMQSDATAGTLIKNAVEAGYMEGDLEERVVTGAEYLALLPHPSAAEIVLKEIVAIEQTMPITHRFVRELTLLLYQIVQALIDKINALDMENVSLIEKINALDNEVAVLASRAPNPMTPRAAEPLPTLDPPPYGVAVVSQIDAQIVALREQL